jgi:hypothetical protein
MRREITRGLALVPIAMVAVLVGAGPVLAAREPSTARQPSVAASSSPEPGVDAANYDSEALEELIDPVAVPVAGGYRIRLGLRNNGPTLTGDSLRPAAKLVLFVPDMITARAVRAPKGCELVPEEIPSPFPPPVPGPPILIVMTHFNCPTGQTLRTGATLWWSFVFPGLGDTLRNVRVVAARGIDAPSDGDRAVVVRAGTARPGTQLPVTGTGTPTLVGFGVILIVAGAAILKVSAIRRRRATL